MIPYTNDAFNIIAKNSRFFHNNQEIPNDRVKFHLTDVNTNMFKKNDGEFIQSLVNEIDVFIQSILYDVDIRNKTHTYICRMIEKYRQFMNRDVLSYVSQLDHKYARFLGMNFIQDTFAQYVCDNVMINE